MLELTGSICLFPISQAVLHHSPFEHSMILLLQGTIFLPILVNRQQIKPGFTGQKHNEGLNGEFTDCKPNPPEQVLHSPESLEQSEGGYEKTSKQAIKIQHKSLDTKWSEGQQPQCEFQTSYAAISQNYKGGIIGGLLQFFLQL